MLLRMCQLFTVRLVTVIGFIGWAGIAQSVEWLDTGWRSRDQIPVGARFSKPVHIVPAAHLLYNGYWVFPGGKAAGAWRWPPTPSSAEVKEGVGLYLYSPSGTSWPVKGWNLPLPFNGIHRTYRPLTMTVRCLETSGSESRLTQRQNPVTPNPQCTATKTSELESDVYSYHCFKSVWNEHNVAVKLTVRRSKIVGSHGWGMSK